VIFPSVIGQRDLLFGKFEDQCGPLNSLSIVFVPTPPLRSPEFTTQLTLAKLSERPSRSPNGSILGGPPTYWRVSEYVASCANAPGATIANVTKMASKPRICVAKRMVLTLAVLATLDKRTCTKSKEVQGTRHPAHRPQAPRGQSLT
jgi:hypothetical protein